MKDCGGYSKTDIQLVQLFFLASFFSMYDVVRVSGISRSWLLKYKSKTLCQLGINDVIEKNTD